MAVGPIYGVQLLDSLPLDGRMRQALPDADDLVRVRNMSERTAAGYEVLLEHYRRLQTIVDRLPKTADGVIVLPGDIVWRLGLKGMEKRNVQWSPNQILLPEYWTWFGVEGPPVLVSECWSTEEAVEAAGGK